MKINEVLEQLSLTFSSNEKKRILQESKSDRLKQIFKFTYDPFITFGISKVDASDVVYGNYSEVSEDVFWDVYVKSLLECLMKRELTGNAARDEIKKVITLATPEDGAIVLNILKKDLRIGAGKKLINAVYENLFPEDFCMSANKYSKKKVSYPVWADSKLDGVRCIAVVDENEIKLFSRNGKEFKNYGTIEDEIRQLDLPAGTRLDGEITMGHFQDLMRTVSRKDEGIELAKDAVYNIFDLPEESIPLSKRLENLADLGNIIEKKQLRHLKLVDGRWLKNEDEMMKFYNEQLENGQEGIMIKSSDGLYEFKRGWGWQKLKPEHTDDLEIIDTEEGTGKYAGQLGAFVCRLENGENVRVGSGLKDEERIELWNRREELIGQVIEVKYQEKTKDGSLRFPIFIKFRPDKS